MKALKIEQNELSDKGVTSLTLSGDIDVQTVHQLEKSISALFAKSQYQIILDLSKVDYISSAGAGVFIGALLKARENRGELVLVNPNRTVQGIFDILGLSQVLSIVEDFDEALALMRVTNVNK